MAVDLQERQRGLLRELAELEAQDAKLYARRMQVRAEIAQVWEQPQDGVEQFAILELAGTARIGQHRAGTQLQDAVRLDQVFTRTLALLSAGLVFQQSVVLLLQLTAGCTEQVQRG